MRTEHQPPARTGRAAAELREGLHEPALRSSLSARSSDPQTLMDALGQAPGAHAVLDSPKRWSADGALLGAMAGFFSPLLVLLSEPVTLYTLQLVAFLTLCGGSTGAALGRPVRSLLNRLRRRLSIRSLAVLMPALGAIWGTLAVTATMVLLMAGSEFSPAVIAGTSVGHGVMIGGPIGAVMFALLWLPYAVTAVMRLSRWPVLLATAVASPLLTWVWLTALRSI
ncbi:MAG: hypothetical protein AAF602_06805 [Myxococcota bacterium]